MKSVCFNSVFLLLLISYQKDYIYVNMINAFSISFHCVNCIASEVCVIFYIALLLKITIAIKFKICCYHGVVS